MPISIAVDVRYSISVPRTPQVIAWMQTAMRSATAAVMQRAQQNLSGRFLKVRTGEGVRSLRTRIRTSKGQVIGTVGTPVFYLRILHAGFQAQTLHVRAGKTGFSFFKGGQHIRTKSIQHPGVSARPWMKVAAEESHQDIVAAFDQVPANIARFIGGGGAGGIGVARSGSAATRTAA